MTARQRRAPTRRTISRDTVSFVLGWFLIIWQGTVADPFNPTVFGGGILIALVPGALAAWAMRMTGQQPTDPPSSPSVQAQPSEPSAS